MSSREDSNLTRNQLNEVFSERLSFKDFNQISNQSRLTNLFLGKDDFEIHPDFIFNDSFYSDIESLTCQYTELEKNFNVFCMNIQCLHSKFDLLKSSIESFYSKNIELSVIMLQETWQDIIELDIELNGYDSFYLPRTCSAE